MLRAYDCTEILESGCILSGIHAHKAHSIFPADSRILCRRNGPISPYPSDIMCRESKDLMSLMSPGNNSRVLGKSRVRRPVSAHRWAQADRRAR